MSTRSSTSTPQRSWRYDTRAEDLGASWLAESPSSTIPRSIEFQKAFDSIVHKFRHFPLNRITAEARPGGVFYQQVQERIIKRLARETWPPGGESWLEKVQVTPAGVLRYLEWPKDERIITKALQALALGKVMYRGYIVPDKQQRYPQEVISTTAPCVQPIEAEFGSFTRKRRRLNRSHSTDDEYQPSESLHSVREEHTPEQLAQLVLDQMADSDRQVTAEPGLQNPRQPPTDIHEIVDYNDDIPHHSLETPIHTGVCNTNVATLKPATTPNEDIDRDPSDTIHFARPVADNDGVNGMNGSIHDESNAPHQQTVEESTNDPHDHAENEISRRNSPIDTDESTTAFLSSAYMSLIHTNKNFNDNFVISLDHCHDVRDLYRRIADDLAEYVDCAPEHVKVSPLRVRLGWSTVAAGVPSKADPDWSGELGGRDRGFWTDLGVKGEAAEVSAGRFRVDRGHGQEAKVG
ncbi:hypothetical protein MBLNU457_6190t1 [Dothideomycetes sp. NU457]